MMKMNRQLFFGLVVLSFCACNGLKTVEKKDEQGHVLERYTIDPKTQAKQGLCETFYPEGQKASESSYVNGVLQGRKTLFYPDGKVQQYQNFDKNGVISGEYQSFHENGQLKAVGQYSGGAMNGTWHFYYATGQLKETVYFVNNEENGFFMEYHENGQIAAEGTYKNNLEEGLLKTYDINGQCIKQMMCQAGVCQTIWKKDLGVEKPTKL